MKYAEGAQHTSKDGRNWVVQNGQWAEVPQGAERHEVYDPTEGMSTFDKFAAGAGKGVYDLGRGLGQLVGAVDEKDVADARKRDAALMDTTPGMLGNVAGQIATALTGGSVLRGAGAAGSALAASRTGAAAATAGNAGRAATAVGNTIVNPTTVSGAATGGALIGAAQPTVKDESRGLNALGGAAGGALGYGVASGVGRLLRPTRAPLSPRDQAMARRLEREGVQLDALDLTESKPLKVLESVFENVPLTAGRAGTRTERRAGQYTRAVLRSMGADADRVTPEILDQTAARLGRQFDAFVTQAPLNVDQQFVGEVDTLLQRIGQLPPELRPSGDIASLLQRFRDMGQYVQSGQSPQILAETYQRMNSALSKKARGKALNEPDAAAYYNEIREALDGLVERNLGGDTLGAFRDVKRQYRNFKVVEKAANNTKEAFRTGFVNPQDLRSALSTAGKEKVVRGRSDLANLAQAGMRFENLTPNSGTAQRAMMQEWLMNPMSLGAISGGGSYAAGADPATAAAMMGAGVATPLMMQRMMYSPAMRNYISQGVVPDSLVPLGQAGRVGLTRLGTAGLLAE